jgi:hypothetical protein
MSREPPRLLPGLGRPAAPLPHSEKNRSNGAFVPGVVTNLLERSERCVRAMPGAAGRRDLGEVESLGTGHDACTCVAIVTLMITIMIIAEKPKRSRENQKFRIYNIEY